jgi:hypothetical protein
MTADLESLCSPEERVEAKLGCGRQTFEYEEAQLLVCSLRSALSCSVHVSQPSKRRDDKFKRASLHLEVVGEFEVLTVDRFLTSIASEDTASAYMHRRCKKDEEGKKTGQKCKKYYNSECRRREIRYDNMGMGIEMTNV